MSRTTLVLVVVCLATLLFTAPAFGQSSPTHAGDPGPPAHAAAGDAGPPDHARAASGSVGGDEAPSSTSDAGATVDAEPAPSQETTSDAVAGDAGGLATSPQTAPAAPAPGAGNPSTSDARSSSVPSASTIFMLFGPAATVGLLAVGLVARSRVPEPEDPEDADGVEGDEPAVRQEDGDPDPEPTGPEPPTPGPTGLLTLGQRALARGDIEAARDWFRTAAIVDPQRQAAHFCLGLCLSELDRPREAEAALAEAYQLQPGDLEATYAHAQVLARLGRTREALAKLETLADEMPGLADRLSDDDAWAPLHDHPRWLALAGEFETRFEPVEALDEPCT